ncbi:MAG: PAS domain S-box protein [Bacteroidales bacterium]|nr:PAS domain S-box protein [Bacteroidales bacterium]
MSKFFSLLFKTLRGRLILSVALVHAVLMTLFIVDTTNRQQQALLIHHKLSALRLTQTISISAAGWIVSNDISGLQEIVDEQRHFPGIQYAMITDARGKILATIDSSKIGRFLVDLPMKEEPTVIAQTDDIVDVAVPSFVDKKHIGWVRIGLRPVKEEQDGLIVINGLVYALIAILIGSFFAWYMGVRITRRLYSVQETINEVKSGNQRARTDVSGEDEAARLAYEFNKMLDTLEIREFQLKESRQVVEGILNAIPVRVFWKDRNLIYKGCNQKFAEDAGFERPEEIIGKDDYELSWKSNAVNYRKDDLEVLQTGEPKLNIEEPQTALDGSVRMLYTTKIALRDIYGNITGVLGTYMDVTERVNQDLALRKNEEILKTVFDNSPIGIEIFDREGFLINSNVEVNNLFGTDAEVLKGIYNLRTDPNYQSDGVWGKLDQGQEVRMELALDFDFVNYPTKKTGVVYLDIVTKPIPESVTKEIGYITQVMDITSRKDSEKAIVENEMKYRALFENTGTSVLIIDEDATISLANAEFSRRSGYSREEIEGKIKWTSIVDAQDIPWMVEQHLLRRQNPEYAKSSYQFHYLTKAGELRNALINIDMMPNTTQSIASMIDITDRIRAEKELIVAKEKAEENDRLKSAFLANVSHEIRTPMNSILGFSELLKDENQSKEDKQKYISIIEKSGERMLNVINNILNISKLEANQMDVSISEVDINEQIDYLCSLFAAEAQAKGVSFLCHCKEKQISHNSIIKTDKEKLYAILSNLIKNAIKYTDRGTVSCGYVTKDGYLEFYVKDTGIGIPSDRLRAIFERFVQADVADKRAFQGVGLGLSIAKEYVELLGGRIWVESEVNKGSIFFFTIPFEPGNIISKVKIKSAKNNNPMKLKILIAEDDDASDLMLTLKLKKLGHEIFHATNGQEAVEVCRANPSINLVLMDIKMPVMDGYDAVRQIRKFNSEVAIIAQTAYGLTGEKEKAIQIGCNDYIPKPINYSLLMMLIQKHCQMGE